MIVAGGGTGGHLFPGLAVAEALTAQGDADVVFVGSAYGIEATAVPPSRFPFEPLVVRGLRGRGVRGGLELSWQLPRALLKSLTLVRRIQPDVVLGLGGYASVPVALAAWLRRVPLVLLEQNARPGLANRFLARLARAVCTTFADSERFFPKGRSVQTGNPVRRLAATEQPSPDGFTLFVFGGSQGAHTLNLATVEAAERLARRLPRLYIIHQTGAADLEWVCRRYRELGIAAEVLTFVQDMGAAYGRADLVVCRAGAGTLAELSLMGKPSILVPYPFAADDHQRANAEVLARSGAAEVIADEVLSGERLAACVEGLVGDRERRAAMSAAVRRFAVPDATARVVAVCRQVAAEGGRG